MYAYGGLRPHSPTEDTEAPGCRQCGGALYVPNGGGYRPCACLEDLILDRRLAAAGVPEPLWRASLAGVAVWRHLQGDWVADEPQALLARLGEAGERLRRLGRAVVVRGEASQTVGAALFREVARRIDMIAYSACDVYLAAVRGANAAGVMERLAGAGAVWLHNLPARLARGGSWAVERCLEVAGPGRLLLLTMPGDAEEGMVPGSLEIRARAVSAADPWEGF